MGGVVVLAVKMCFLFFLFYFIILNDVSRRVPLNTQIQHA